MKKYNLVEIIIDENIKKFAGNLRMDFYDPRKPSKFTGQGGIKCFNPDCENDHFFQIGEKMFLLKKEVGGKSIRKALYCSVRCDRHARMLFLSKERELPNLEES